MEPPPADAQTRARRAVRLSHFSIRTKIVSSVCLRCVCDCVFAICVCDCVCECVCYHVPDIVLEMRAWILVDGSTCNK